MNVFEKIKFVLFRPSTFFSKIKDATIKETFIYFLILSAFYNILLVFSNSFFGTNSILAAQFAALDLEISSSLLYIPLIPIFIIMHAAFIFLLTALYHLFVHIVKGKGDFSKTFIAVVYSNTPMLLFGWIPFLSFLLIFYNLFLFIVGISSLHKISRGKAFTVYLGPIILSILVGILILLLSLSLGFYILKSRFSQF